MDRKAPNELKIKVASVLGRAGPGRSWLALLCISLSGAFLTSTLAQEDEVTLPSLEGRWVLTRLSGEHVTSDPPVYFELTDEVISGYDGCNRFGGALGGPIRIGGRGCADRNRLLPLDLARPAEHLMQATLEGDQLLLPLEDGSEAEFRRRDG